jgi:hypothetical protein
MSSNQNNKSSGENGRVGSKTSKEKSLEKHKKGEKETGSLGDESINEKIRQAEKELLQNQGEGGESETTKHKKEVIRTTFIYKSISTLLKGEDVRVQKSLPSMIGKILLEINYLILLNTLFHSYLDKKKIKAYSGILGFDLSSTAAGDEKSNSSNKIQNNRNLFLNITIYKQYNFIIKLIIKYNL